MNKINWSKLPADILFFVCFVLAMFFVVVLVQGCATTDHDRYDRYGKTLSEMQQALSHTEQMRIQARGQYMVSVANQPFLVLRFNDAGTKLKEVVLNNSLFLNQAAVMGGGDAYKQFAFAQTVQHISRPQPYWYERLAGGVADNFGSALAFGGMTWLGIRAIDATAATAAAAIPSQTYNINSQNTTSDGSVSTTNAVMNSSAIDNTTGVAPGAGAFVGSSPLTNTATATATDTGTDTSTGTSTETE